MPNNYLYSENRQLDEGCVRFTAQANFEKWNSLDDEAYRDEKKQWFDQIGESACKYLPVRSFSKIQECTVSRDMFTPKTVKKFTGRLDGAVYGSPFKNKAGKTHLENLYICGTDQGFLGIIGAMLSGITIANMYAIHD